MSLAQAASTVEAEFWGIASRAQRGVMQRVDSSMLRKDRFVWLIVVAIAVVIVLGLMTAWFMYCRGQGGWPAVNMPSWQSGGTWKLYCAR